MDTIWDRKSFEVAVVAGMKKPIDHAEPTKSNVKFIFYKKQKIQYVITTPFLRAIPVLYLITSKLCYTQQCLCGTNIRDFHSLINYPLIWLFRMSKRTYVHVYLDYITDTSHNVQDKYCLPHNSSVRSQGVPLYNMISNPSFNVYLNISIFLLVLFSYVLSFFCSVVVLFV